MRELSPLIRAILPIVLLSAAACGPTPPDPSAIPSGSLWWCRTSSTVRLGQHTCERSAASCPTSETCDPHSFAWCVTFYSEGANRYECFVSQEDCAQWHAESCSSISCSLCGSVQ